MARDTASYVISEWPSHRKASQTYRGAELDEFSIREWSARDESIHYQCAVLGAEVTSGRALGAGISRYPMTFDWSARDETPATASPQQLIRNYSKVNIFEIAFKLKWVSIASLKSYYRYTVPMGLGFHGPWCRLQPGMASSPSSSIVLVLSASVSVIMATISSSFISLMSCISLAHLK